MYSTEWFKASRWRFALASRETRTAKSKHARAPGSTRYAAPAGILSLAIGLVSAPAYAQVAVFTVLHNFSAAEAGPAQNGTSGLVQGSDGNYYGVNTDGGGSCTYNGVTFTYGCGTLFRITPAGVYTTLHTFDGADGANPQALVLGSDGNLYGTTNQGGSPDASTPGGYGTIFQATLSGTVTTIYSSFSGFGGFPGILVSGGKGILYGSATSDSGYPEVFQVTYGGALSTIYTFTDGSDGNGATSLALGSDGNLYGASAVMPSTANASSAIFMLTPGGTFTLLGSYPGYYGNGPIISFVLASDGNLYGTNEGTSPTFGNVFKIPPGGPLTSVYSFTNGADGSSPNVILQGTDGNFYGMEDAGQFFQFTTAGTLKVLGQSQSVSIPTNLTQGIDGNFVGTTIFGGSNGLGIVYGVALGSLTVSLIDPLPTLVNGLGVVTNPTSLAASTSNVAGVAADGAAEIVVRVKAPAAGVPITLSLTDESGNPAGSGDGPNLGYLTTLLSADGSGSTEDGVPITVTTVPLSDGTGMAFAVYHAPVDFVRDGNAVDPNIDSRQVSIVAQVPGEKATTPLQVVRPPIAFVHGIWGHPSDGDQITSFLQSVGLGISASEVGYDGDVQVVSSSPSYGTNYVVSGDNLGFKYAATSVLRKIENVISLYRTNNALSQPVAVVRADVVAHSMGGDVARTLPLIGGFSSPLNYSAGVIHKLITVGTPHLGSPLATQLLQSVSSCTRTVLQRLHRYAFTSVSSSVGSFTGAIGDLQGNLAGTSTSLSTALQAVQPGTTKTTVTIPTGLVVGSMTPAQLATVDTSADAKIIRVICGSDPLATALTSTGWPTIMGQGSDAIVPLNSELAGSASSPVPVLSAVHSPGAEELGFADGSPPGPSEIDSASGVPNEVLQLLNTPVSSAAFKLLP